MKTSQIVAVYNALMGSKLTKMSGEGKIKVVKIIKEMKPIATEFEDFKKDALERLKPENFEDMAKKAEQWQKDGENTTFTTTERFEINKFFAEYQAEVDKCLKEEMEKEYELKFNKLSDEEFEKFADSNDYTAGQLIELMNVLQ